MHLFLFTLTAHGSLLGGGRIHVEDRQAWSCKVPLRRCGYLQWEKVRGSDALFAQQ